MRTELSSLDLMFLKNELKNLIGGRIQKAYQKDKEIRLEIFLSGKGTFELYFAPGKLFISEYKRVAGEAESFAMNLRKNISGQIITDVRQPGFERIIELETENNILIFELFSKGNVILCQKDYMIIMPLEVQLWRDRQITPRKKYNYPPAVANPFILSPQEFASLISSSRKPIVKFLAVDLSFSGLYAEELCLRAGIEKTKISNTLTAEEKKALFSSLHSIVKEFNPQIVFEDKKPIDIVPIKMRLYKGKEARSFASFTTALDEYFTHREAVGIELEKKEEMGEEMKRLERIVDEQKQAIKKWRKIEKESRKKAEAIYNNYGLVENIIAGIKKARDSGLSWEEIKERLEKETTPEASAIKEIREKEGIVVLNL
ncbi:MAG: NFACT family protein [Candidatus Aenigmatarchaeota archaeon]